MFLNTIFTIAFANVIYLGVMLYFRGRSAGDELCSGGVDCQGGFELPVGRAVNS